MDINALNDLKNKYGINPNLILDVGACNGWFANLCKSVWPVASITLIEANPLFIETLQKTGLHYIITLLGNEQKSNVNFYVSKKDKCSSGCSIYKEISEHFNEENCDVVYLPMDTLDNLVTDRFDLIKMDTQGSELDIMKGGKNTLNKAKYLLVEVSLTKCNEGAPLKDEIVNYLKSVNFNLVDVIYSHYLDGNVIQEDVLFKHV